MILLRMARPMLAGIFVFSGVDALRDAKPKVDMARSFLDTLHSRVGGLPEISPETAVRVDAVVKLGAGTTLALGRLPRLSALVLAASLVPGTFAGHRYWIHRNPAERVEQQIHLLKNLAVMGGLVVAASCTGKHAARRSLKKGRAGDRT
ncbi:MAG: DoxX family protein [Kutzneria sp.]|nr:DoxX family protein [Kutzneria sp.]